MYPNALSKENLLQTTPESNEKSRSYYQPNPQQNCSDASFSVRDDCNHLGQSAPNVAEQFRNRNVDSFNYLNHGPQNNTAATSQQLQTVETERYSNLSGAGDNQYASPIPPTSNGIGAEQRSLQDHHSMAYSNFSQQPQNSNNMNRTFNSQQYATDPGWSSHNGIPNHSSGGSGSSCGEGSFSGASFSADTAQPAYYSHSDPSSIGGITPSSCSYSQPGLDRVATSLDYVASDQHHVATGLDHMTFQQPAPSTSQFIQPNNAPLPANHLQETQSNFSCNGNDLSQYATQANNYNQPPIPAVAQQPQMSLTQQHSTSSNYQSAPQLSHVQQDAMFGSNYRQNNNFGGKIRPSATASEKSLLVKPPFTLIAITEMALKSAESKRMTLQEIYQWIKNKFPFYRQNEKKWQNSLRHCLSFNDCFVKIPRPGASSRKNCYWSLHPDAQNMFENGHYLRRPQRFRCDTDKENVES